MSLDNKARYVNGKENDVFSQTEFLLSKLFVYETSPLLRRKPVTARCVKFWGAFGRGQMDLKGRRSKLWVETPIVI